MTIIVYTDPVDGKQRRLRPAPGFTLAQAAAQVPAGTSYEEVPDPPGRNYVWQSGAWQAVAAPAVMEVARWKFEKALKASKLDGTLAPNGFSPRSYGAFRDAMFALPAIISSDATNTLTVEQDYLSKPTVNRDLAVSPYIRDAALSIKSGDGAAADAFLDAIFARAAAYSG